VWASSAGDHTHSNLFMPQARRNLKSASDALRRLGWFSFWSQLTLSVVSTFILIFSVSFSATVRCHCRASALSAPSTAGA